jgi:hypothetical protein
MGLLIFWFGMFFILKGAVGLVYLVWSSLNCIIKFGQVVGFSEGKERLFQTVLRFKSLDHLEYFLIDHKISSAPSYVMGEFIPILISIKDPKKVMISPNISLTKNFGYVLAGFLCLGLQFAFFSLSVLGLLISVMFFCGIHLYFKKEKKISPLKHFFSFINPFSQLAASQVCDIEDSKLIAWTENYIGLLAPDVKRPFSFHFLSRLLKPIYLMGTVTFIIFSISSYKNVLNHTQQAQKFLGRYDRSVMTEVGYSFKIEIPQIQFYDSNRRVFKLLDKSNPFDYDLKSGDEVTILVSSKDPQNMRRDLKNLNQWKAYLFASLAFLFLLLSSRSRAQYKKEAKTPVIRIKKAG